MGIPYRIVVTTVLKIRMGNKQIPTKMGQETSAMSARMTPTKSSRGPVVVSKPRPIPMKMEHPIVKTFVSLILTRSIQEPAAVECRTRIRMETGHRIARTSVS